MSDDRFDIESTRRYAQQEQKLGHPQAEEALNALEEACDEIEKLRNAIRQMRDEGMQFERERIAKFALREDTDDDQQ